MPHQETINKDVYARRVLVLAADVPSKSFWEVARRSVRIAANSEMTETATGKRERHSWR